MRPLLFFAAWLVCGSLCAGEPWTLILFTGPACPPCERAVAALNDPKAALHALAKTIRVEIRDTENPEHAAQLRALGQRGTPTWLFLPPDSDPKRDEKRLILVGFANDAETADRLTKHRAKHLEQSPPKPAPLPATTPEAAKPRPQPAPPAPQPNPIEKLFDVESVIDKIETRVRQRVETVVREQVAPRAIGIGSACLCAVALAAFAGANLGARATQ
jgi:glutaredoxin